MSMQNKAIFGLFILVVIFFKLPSQKQADLKHLETALRNGEVTGIKVIYNEDPYFYQQSSHFSRTIYMKKYPLKVDPYTLRDKVESIYYEPDFPESYKIPIQYLAKEEATVKF